MIRNLMYLVLATFLFSILAGCIIVDGHHRGVIPPGQVKKMNK